MKPSTPNPKFLNSSLIIALLVFFLSCSDNAPEPFNPMIGNSDFVLFINELNASGDPLDWIEIYNPGMEAVDLEGFFLFDDHTDKYQIPSGFIVPPEGYIRFFCDGLATGDHTNFRLAANGELIALEDPKENVVDFVEYPRIREGQFYGRFPDGTASLFISGIQTPELSNGANPGPALQRLNRDPLVPTTGQDVLVSVQGFHQKGQIAEVQLFYRLDQANFDSVAMDLSEDSTYLATIPASQLDAVIDYYVSAIDQEGLQTNRPLGTPDSIETIIIDSTPLPQLVINEFLAINDACCADTDGGVEEFDDWIEIYNMGTDAVDIGGFHVSDDPLDPFKHRIPDNQPVITTIQPGGFLLIWADGDSEQGPLHAEIRLSSQGETAGLYYFDGRTIDSYQFDVQEVDVSMGRLPDGTANWVKFTDPTPGASN